MKRAQLGLPTIREKSFDAERDAKALRKGMKGIGTDEDAIINVLTKRTNNQLQEISEAYWSLYSKDLVKDIKSEISGNFEDAMVALMTPHYDFLAKTVHEAVDGAGTDEQALIDVLCTEDHNEEIVAIQEAYERLYKNSMTKDISRDTTGYFKRLLLSICKGKREERSEADSDESDSDEVDSRAVEKDAQALVRAGVEKVGTDESEFIRILTSRSYPHLRAVFEEYETIASQSIEASIKSEFSGDIERGLLAIVRCVKNRPSYFAKRLRAAMKGAGTNDSLLIFIVVSRAELDLGSIAKEYARLYSENLVKDIKSETSGDYERALVSIFGL